jgi:lysophospholipase L1-like esterase
MKSYLTILTIAVLAAAEVPAWAKCGGDGYTGDTTCSSGYACAYVNQWYWQCRPASDIHYLGRVNTATKELSWPSTGVAFTFEGTFASIAVTQITGSNSVDLFIDNNNPVVISNVAGSSISTPSGLSWGNHTVQLRKRSEAATGSIWIGDITTDGTLIPSAATVRKIEVVGDSISVGYGLDGTAPCSNSAALEDNPKTYAALAATSLNADYSIVAYSGRGLTRNYVSATPDSNPTMPILYTRYGANDADNSYTFPSDWTPDAVVINLGTNDWGYILYDSSGNPYDARPKLDITTYTNTMVSFVKSIQGHYPNAQFFLLSSPMLGDGYPSGDYSHTTQVNALMNAVSQIGSNAHFVDWLTEGSATGCDYHPNAATQAAEGQVLASAIKSALRW